MPRWPGARQRAPEAPEVVVGLLLAARRREGGDGVAARLQGLGDALDGAALAGGVPALEHAPAPAPAARTCGSAARAGGAARRRCGARRLLGREPRREVDALRARVTTSSQRQAGVLGHRPRASAARSRSCALALGARGLLAPRCVRLTAAGRLLAPLPAPPPCCAHQRLEDLHARPARVGRLHHRPGRARGVGAGQHLLDRLHPVGRSARLRRQSSFCHLPALGAGPPPCARRRRRCSLREMWRKNFTSTWPSSREPALELVDLVVGRAPDLLACTTLLDALHQHAAVPGVVEQDHVAVLGQPQLVAPEEVVAPLQLRGRRAGPGAEGARVEPLGEPLDDGALAGRVPALEHDDGGDLRLQQLRTGGARSRSWSGGNSSW